MADYTLEHLANMLNNGYSASEVADRYGISPSGVRGMVSRWRKQQKLREQTIEFERTEMPLSQSEQRVQAVVDRGEAKLNKFLAKPRNVKFMYTSDHHWPYADERAISLNIQIARVFQPDLITDLSDFFDFADYSHWDNLKTPASQLWGSDLQRPLDLHADWHKKIEKVLRKKPIWLALWGNHDLWLYDFLMNQRGGAGIYTFASFLEELENNGTLINSWPDRKHVVKVSPRLKLVHGVNASKNPGTVAKNTLEDFAGKHYEPDAGQFYNVVYGHDHRSTVYDYYGVTAYGSGCNCLTNMPYLRAPANWQLGVVIGHFNTQSNVVDAQRINFYPTENGGLTCFVGEEQLFS